MSATTAAPVAVAYRPRWRHDAAGRVSGCAGQWASNERWSDRSELEEIVRQMPNGDQVEIVEVTR